MKCKRTYPNRAIIVIQQPCEKCNYCSLERHRDVLLWKCLLFDQFLEDYINTCVNRQTSFRRKYELEPVHECRLLIERYWKMPEKDGDA